MKAQGQRDLANAQPPGSGAWRPAASCLSVSFLQPFPAKPHCAAKSRGHQPGWGQPGTPAGNSCWVSEHSLIGTGSGTDGLHRTNSADSCCPGAHEEGGTDSGKLHFMLQPALLSLLRHSQAAAWCSQLDRQHPCAFVTSLLCTGKSLGHVPKYPNALWRGVGLETSKCSESLPV